MAQNSNVERDWIQNEDPDDRIPDVDDETWNGYMGFLTELEVVLRAHFGKFEHLKHADFLKLADRLAYTQSNALYDFWSVPETLDHLAKFKSHILFARDLWAGFPEIIQSEFQHVSLENTGYMGKRVNQNPWTNLDNDKVLKHPAYQPYRAASDFFDLIDSFLELIPAVEVKARTGIPTGTKAIESWRVVAACAWVCELFPGTIHVPKAMNEAGPFYRLLCDVFDVFQIVELPTSAFRGWRKHVGS